VGRKTTTQSINQSINQSIHSPVVCSKTMLRMLAFISKTGETAYLLAYLLTYLPRLWINEPWAAVLRWWVVRRRWWLWPRPRPAWSCIAGSSSAGTPGRSCAWNPPTTWNQCFFTTYAAFRLFPVSSHITVAELMNKSDHDLFGKLCAPTHKLSTPTY